MIKIGSILVKYDESDDYALIDQKDVKGGYHSVSTLSDRDSLNLSVKKSGMLVYVESVQKTYRLVGASWNEIKSSKIVDYETFTTKSDLLASTKGFKKATFIRVTSDNSTYIVNKDVTAPTKLTNADLDNVTATDASHVNYAHTGLINEGGTVQDAIAKIAKELDEKSIIYVDSILTTSSKTYDAADAANKDKVFIVYCSQYFEKNSSSKLINIHPLINTIIDEQAILVYVKNKQWYIKKYEKDLIHKFIYNLESNDVNLYLGLDNYEKLNIKDADEISIKPINDLNASNVQEALSKINGKVIFETIDASVSKDLKLSTYGNKATYVEKDGNSISFDGVKQNLKLADVIVKYNDAFKVIRSSTVPDLPADSAIANYFLGESGGSLKWREISNDGFLTQRAVFISNAAIGNASGQVPIDRILNKVVVSEATSDIILSLYPQGFKNGDKFMVLNPTDFKYTVETAGLGLMQGANVVDAQLVLRKAESAIIVFEDGKFFVLSHKNPVHLSDGTWIDPMWGLGDKRPYIDFTTTLEDSGKDKGSTINGSLDNVWKPNQTANASGKELKFKLKNNKREKFLGLGIVFDRSVVGFNVGSKLKVYGSNDGGTTKEVLTDQITTPPDDLLKKLAFYGHFFEINFVQNIDYYNEYIVEIESGSINATPFWQEFVFKYPYHGIITDVKSINNIDDNSFSKTKTWSAEKSWTENDKIQDHRLIADSLMNSGTQVHLDMFYRSGVVMEANQNVYAKKINSKDSRRRYLDPTAIGVNSKINNRPGFYALAFDGRNDFGEIKEEDGSNVKLSKIIPNKEFAIAYVIRPKEFAGGVDLVQVKDYDALVVAGTRLTLGLYQSGISCALGGGGGDSDYVITRVELDNSDLQKDLIVIVSLDTRGKLNMQVRGDGKLNKSHSINIGNKFILDDSYLTVGKGFSGGMANFDLMEFVMVNGGSSIWNDRERYFDYFSRKWGIDI
ncbi:hypothetical protein VME_45680 [Vibrio harveyi 1DA3]|nr:hypothetical protein VME_45680 [Vibrio harveyi 1DA3]